MKKVSVLLLTVFGYLSLAKVAFGATEGVTIVACPTEGTFAALCNITFNNLFSALVTAAFVIASLIALAFLIFGGIKWITSGGDKAGVESARNMIVAALVGLVITFLAYLLLTILFNFFGLDITALTIPPIGTTPAE
jgi:hypothetical protein